MSLTYRYRICLVGDAGTGKSNFFERAIKLQPPQYVGPTLGTAYGERSVPIEGGHTLKVLAWDTSGDSRSRHATLSCCSKMGVLLFFVDPYTRMSFVHLRNWYNDLLDKLEPTTRLGCVVVHRDRFETEDRIVEYDEIESAANEFGMTLYEVDATDVADVQRVLKEVISEVYDHGDPSTILWDDPRKQGERAGNNLENHSNRCCLAGCFKSQE